MFGYLVGIQAPMFKAYNSIIFSLEFKNIGLSSHFMVLTLGFKYRG